MTAPEHADLRNLIERQSADIARRVAAHPDRAHLAVQGARDLVPAVVRTGLDVRFEPDGTVLARRSDAISPGFRVIVAVDGTTDVALVRRWATERGSVPRAVDLSDADWAVVVDAVVAIVRREHTQTQRTWPTQTLEAAVARRVLVSQACRIDDREDLVGHARVDEPTRAQLAEYAAKVAAQSPVNRLMAGAPLSPWPEDRPVTAAFLEALAATTSLVQTHEGRPDWGRVVDEIRALVQRR